MRRFLPNLRDGSTFSRVMVDDQARTSLAGQECPHPLDKNAYFEIGCGQKLDVNSCPSQPGDESAEANFAALQHSESFTHHRHVSFVEISERTRRRLPCEP